MSAKDANMAEAENTFMDIYSTINTLFTENEVIVEKSIYSHALVLDNIVESAKQTASRFKSYIMMPDKTVTSSYVSDYDISFPRSDEYSDIGVTTYRGNNYRDSGFYGNISISEQKLEEISMVKNQIKYRGRNTLSFECDNKQNLKYADKDSDENYVKFEELGVIKNSIIVIQKTEYNSEKYILLETKSCRQLILEGFPLRIENTEKYIVLNNPGTDEAYKIQILEYKNEFFEIKHTISISKEIYPKSILKVEDDFVFVLDTKNRIWKITL